MELRVNEITVPESISFNYEELKKEISAKAHQYALAVYSDEQIKLAKSDRATLNKLKKALNDERIRREKEYMQPFIDFKTKINEIISIIDKPVQLIDSQIKNYEEQQKTKKKDDILCYFESCEHPEWISFEMIFNDKWLNASVKMSAIEEEIGLKLEQITADLHTLSGLPEFAFEASEVYKSTLDMNKAISEGKRLSEIARRKAEAERLKAEAEERAKAEAEAKARAEAEAKAKAEEIQPDTDLNTLESGAYTVRDTREDAPKPIEKEWISFKALLSTEDALALKEFFNSRNIEFKAI